MKTPIVYQRIESAVIFFAATYFYFDHGYSWVWYLLLILSMDVFMVGYLFNPKIGAHTYNLGHSSAVPLMLLVVGSITESGVVTGLGFIWLAHIGLDRALGYGLKHTTAFHDTHLGMIRKK